MYNGVSQQPPALRLPSQAQLQENGLSSVVEGIRKRPPTKHIALLSTDTEENTHVHMVNRDKTNQYVVIIKDDDLNVYDIDGTERTVSFPDGKGYLNCSDARTQFSTVTVADYTFIVNKTKRAVKGSTGGAGSLKGTVQNFVDLPDGAANGDIYEVVGDDINNFDNYYVKKVGTVWRETTKPGQIINFNNNTMPHSLIDNGDGTLTFKEIDWDDRYVGDDDSAPFPSFIDRRIADVFFHRNRLGFLADENVIFSRAGDFFNFFPETVTNILDSDPIDVAVSHTSVATLRHATSYNTSLMLFADQAQFQLTAKDTLTPKTTAINATTEFTIEPDAKPVSAGTSLYFGVPMGNHTGIKEYEVQPLTYNNDAADVTAHCPNYVPTGVFKLASSDIEDTIIALSTEDRNTLYIYRYYWASPDEKVQSSWSTWSISPGDVILSADFIDNRLYLVIKRFNGTYLEYIDFSYKLGTGDLGFTVHLDEQQTLTGTYDVDSNETRFDVGYEYTDAAWQGVLSTDFEGKVGGTLNLKAKTGNTLFVLGDWSDGEVYVGKQYNFKYQLSPIYYKDSQKLSVPHYKLSLKNMHMFYDDSGYFKVTVGLRGSGEYYYTLDPTLGDPTLTIGTAVISRGNFRFPIQGDGETSTITIESNSMLPCSLAGAEYEALSVTHSKHMTY
jgi:hypothetical protein